eukprot:c50554_g1_i1 orf=50-295(+)
MNAGIHIHGPAMKLSESFSKKISCCFLGILAQLRMRILPSSFLFTYFFTSFCNLSRQFNLSHLVGVFAKTVTWPFSKSLVL